VNSSRKFLTLKQVFNDLSDVMSSDSTEENKDKIYANLMISVKNVMFDQNIVNKNFLGCSYTPDSSTVLIVPT
jgi:hypothetical protein